MSTNPSLFYPSGALTANYAVRSGGWKGSMWRNGIRAAPVRSVWTSDVRCYAAGKTKGKARAAVAAATEKKKTAMGEDGAFYVLRKGGMIAVYRSLSDCQAQVSSSMGDPAVGVSKGNSLGKEAIEYLTSRGLKNPLYCIDAADWKDDLLGPLITCPFQQPDTHVSLTEATKDSSHLKRSKKVLESNDNLELDAGLSDSHKATNKHPKLEMSSCIIEFDGASKGNPGSAGAGVVVRREDGSVISRLHEGLGEVTNNVAEYRALILGMKFALKRGFKKINVQGDSLLVCNQIEGVWKIKDKKMLELVTEANELKEKFTSFNICHVRREFNSDADSQANLAALLPCGMAQEDSGDFV